MSLSPQSRTYRFLSTLSLRRATSCFAWNCAKCRYFYPRSPCGERLGQGRDLFLVHFISIHALLAESDPTPRRTLPARSRFLSTLSLRRATDKDREKALNIALFLSTLSLRRATTAWLYKQRRKSYFYPRSPCGERRSAYADAPAVAEISIHALLAESDAIKQKSKAVSTNFYPRSPCGERPTGSSNKSISCNFYPRSPCGERHRHKTSKLIINVNFYPRSPCGERLPQE